METNAMIKIGTRIIKLSMIAILLAIIGYYSVLYISKSRRVNLIKQGYSEMELALHPIEVLEILGPPSGGIAYEDSTEVWSYSIGQSLLTPKILYIKFRECKVDTFYIDVD